MGLSFIPFLLQATLALPEVEFLPELSSHAAVGPNWVRGASAPTLIWMERGKAQSMKLQQSAFQEGDWSPKQAQAQSAKAFVNWADFPQAAVSFQGKSLYAVLEHLDHPGLAYGVRLKTGTANTAWLHKDMSGVEHGFPSLVAHPEGGWLAIWLDGRGGKGHGHGPEGEKMSLMATRVAPDGTATREAVVDDRACSCCSTDLAFTQDGTAWAVYRDRGKDEVRDIALVRIPVNPGQGGEKNQADFQPRIPVADGWKIPGCPVNGPALAVEGNQLAYCWFTMGNKGSRPQVRLVFSADGGVTFETPQQIASGRSLGRVDLEFMDSETVLVTWLESKNQGAAWMAKALNIKTGETSPAIPLGEVAGSRADGFLRLSKHQNHIYAAWLEGGAIFTARIRKPTEGWYATQDSSQQSAD